MSEEQRLLVPLPTHQKKKKMKTITYVVFPWKRRRETHDLPNVKDEEEDTDPNKAGGEEDETTDDACISNQS